MAENDDDNASQSKKKRTRKGKVQNFITGRTRRRINSENSATLAQTRRKFVNSSITLDQVSNNTSESSGGNKSEDEQLRELDFLEMLGKLQSNRLDDQRSMLPTSLSKPEAVEEMQRPSQVTISQGSSIEEEEEDVKGPIQQVLALGPPYPLVVLPVEGDYWMEGTNHIQQRDRQNRPVIPKFDLSKCVVESDRTASVYRRNFLGKEHLNYAAVDQKYGPLLLSVKCDSRSVEDGKVSESSECFEVILRLKERTIHQSLPSTSIGENPRPRDIIQFMLADEVDVERFHPIAVPKITEHIVKYDEHVLTNSYKIGVIYQRHGQTTEEEYFGNKTHSNGMEEFLESIASKVSLQGFKGYRGGLDVRHNQTGETSYHTVFRDREFMFHVSTLLPYKPEDKQQVQRKRHIGNDIVAIVFQDENTPFSPTSVRSHFLHVFIVVQVIDANTSNVRYKVTVTARDGVPKFGPDLPNPAIFRKGREFREFFMTKILNAELAACKSEKFSQLAERTRAMLLQQLVSDLISRNEQCVEDSMLARTYSGGKGGILSSFRSVLVNSKSRNGSSQSLNSNLVFQTPTNDLSLSLSDVNDAIAEDTKKEKRKLFSRHRQSKDNSQDGCRKESASSTTVSPASPNNFTWPHQRNVSTNGERDFFGFRSKSVESAPPLKSPNRRFEGSCSASSSPSVSSNRRLILPHSELSNMSGVSRPNDSTIQTRETRSSSFNETDSIRSVDPSRNSSQQYISVSSCSSYEDVSSSSTCSALDAAQREIDIMRSEISKLKSDKMNLVRQNVVYQREIKNYRERSLHQTAELYAAQHELAKLRPTDRGDVNHNQESTNREVDHYDEEMTPVNHKEEVMFFTEDATPKRHMMKARAHTHIGPVLSKTRSDAGSASMHHQPVTSPTKRHSVSHV